MKSLPPAPPQRLPRFGILLALFIANLVAASLLFVWPAVRPVQALTAAGILAILLPPAWRQLRGWRRAYFVLWAILTIATAARSPGSAMFSGAMFGLVTRKQIAGWITAHTTRELLAFGGAFAVLFTVRMVVREATYTVPVTGVFVRIDQALFGWAMAWLWIAAPRAWVEAGRRGIRRAPLKLKLVLAFGIFGATPALLAVLLLSLLAWVRSGQFRAQSVETDLRLHAAVRPWIEPLRRSTPDGAADVITAVSANARDLAVRHVDAGVLERTPQGWRVAGTLGEHADSLFSTPALVAAKDSLYLQSFVVRHDAYRWMEAAIWPPANGRDSLALLTYELVDSARVENLARAMRSDLLMVGGGPDTGDDNLNVNLSLSGAKVTSSTESSAERTKRLRGMTRRERRAYMDSVTTIPAESVIVKLHILMIGTGRYRTYRGGQLSPMPVGVYSVPTLMWNGTRWNSTTVPVFTRPAFAEIAGLRSVYRDPAGRGVDILLAFIFGLALLAWIVPMIWGGRIARLITQGTRRLQVAAQAIGSGDFTTRVEVTSADEFGELAAAFNSMAEGLAAGHEAMRERDRLQHELELARRIQTRLLPAAPPTLPALQVAATNAMSEQVGGDYYDFVPLTDGRIGIAIADVSGHGVGAALLMSSVKAALVSSAAVDSTPCGVTERVNRLLEASMEPGKFVTFFFAALDPVTLRMEYVNAGHPSPLLLRADGSLEKLEEGGFILGIMPDAAYSQGTVTLAPGDTLALFTDGVTEAEAPDKSLYDEARVVELLRREQGRDAATVLERLVDDIRTWEGGRAAADDLTAIVIRAAAAA